MPLRGNCKIRGNCEYERMLGYVRNGDHGIDRTSVCKRTKICEESKAFGRTRHWIECKQWADLRDSRGLKYSKLATVAGFGIWGSVGSPGGSHVLIVLMGSWKNRAMCRLMRIYETQGDSGKQNHLRESLHGRKLCSGRDRRILKNCAMTRV